MHLRFLIIFVLTAPVFVLSSDAMTAIIIGQMKYYQERLIEIDRQIIEAEDEKEVLLGLKELITFMTIDPNDYNETQWKQIEANVQGQLTEINGGRVGTDLLEEYPVGKIDDLLNRWGKEYELPKKEIESIKTKLNAAKGKSEVVRSAFNKGEHEVAVGKVAFHKQEDGKYLDIGIATQFYKFNLPVEKVKIENGFNERCSRYLKYSEDKWCNSTRYAKLKFSNPKHKTNIEADLIDWMEHKLALRYHTFYGFKFDIIEDSVKDLDEKIESLKESKEEYEKDVYYWRDLVTSGKYFASEQDKGMLFKLLMK